MNVIIIYLTIQQFSKLSNVHKDVVYQLMNDLNFIYFYIIIINKFAIEYD
jgi:hypothetical protein